MPKFFADKENIGEKIILDGESAHHIGKVLRASLNDKITVCDGEGKDYFCTIEEITKEKIICSIDYAEDSLSEPPILVTLYQCIPKSGKMDSIIQKAVELGVYEIVPVLSKRCIAKGEKADRWQKISEGASKQSGRGIIPKVRPCISFDEAILELCEKDLPLFPYEEAKDGKISYIDNVKTIGIMIGPEGGFDIKEAEKAKKMGAKIVTLGKRILRTETAGSTVLSILMNLYE